MFWEFVSGCLVVFWCLCVLFWWLFGDLLVVFVWFGPVFPLALLFLIEWF